ncbi:hypothetical protein AXG93_879s1000 [Marchantia polymorpha subsp. ruderalis]|uniref:Uncharacterized protein n=1 Tax=Marchantia polymorpha subsp. ruderalis TaxID=1480154 RepID=A0A176WS15_MARPO|nr:hypothetical protein AXG93_879s1000 [Marchantia polymorpha subsp. ruderalis]
MLKHNFLMKPILIGMPNAIDHNDKYKNVTMDQYLFDAILDVPNWKRRAAVLLLLRPLCAALAHLEGVQYKARVAMSSSRRRCFLRAGKSTRPDEVTGLEIEKKEDIVDDEEVEQDEIRRVADPCIIVDQYLGGEEFEKMILDE